MKYTLVLIWYNSKYGKEIVFQRWTSEFKSQESLGLLLSLTYASYLGFSLFMYKAGMILFNLRVIVS